MEEKIENVNNILNELDEFNMLNDTQPTIDYWQDIRAKAAIVIMHAYLESPAKPNEDISLEKSVRNVVKIADALVDELKKKTMWK